MTVAEFTKPVPLFSRPGRAAPPRPSASAPAGELAKFFRDNHPLLLDGAGAALPRRHFLDAAGPALPANAPGMMPAAVLREVLDRIGAVPRPQTPAGLAVIGPRAARFWWDNSLLTDRDGVPAGAGDRRAVLRFFDVTGFEASGGEWRESGEWHETFDIDVDLASGGKTVQFWRSDRTYGVELGGRRADGAFSPLAGIGVFNLPGDCPAAAGPVQTVHSNLRPGGREPGKIVPDAAALAWAAARPDFPGRDIEAELTLHMLYRSFLAQGPGALRRRLALPRREEDVLAAEYALRRRARAAGARAENATPKPEPAFLVAVLDPARAAAAAGPLRLPARLVQAAPPAGADFAWVEQLVAFARASAPQASLRGPAARSGLVQPLGACHPVPLHQAAAPVFEAANCLRERLAGLRGGGEEPAALAQAQPHAPEQPLSQEPPSRPLVSGSEAGRLARAGVRVTRLSLSIEGRMRPGARLKVAGKLVLADADGNFRLDCLLTGRRAAIPLRAGDAASSINVNWEKRPLRAKSPF